MLKAQQAAANPYIAKKRLHFQPSCPLFIPKSGKYHSALSKKSFQLVSQLILLYPGFFL